MSTFAKTFNDLLAEFVDEQILNLQQGGVLKQYLGEEKRNSILEQLTLVVNHKGEKEPLFDQDSLENIRAVFQRADQYYEQLQNESHPAYFVFEDPLDWFQQSYNFMFDTVYFVEIIRYFAGGKSHEEKEIVFRSLVSKLIKTQDTLRTISNNQEFLDTYAENNPKLTKHFPEFAQNSLPSSTPLTIESAIKKSLQRIVQDIGINCLKIFKILQIRPHSKAKPSFEKKQYYDALIITIRHSKEDLFSSVAPESYNELIFQLTKIIEISHLHPQIFLFAHIKRRYLTYWLLYTLRGYDKEENSVSIQEEKSKIYEKFEELEMEVALLTDLKSFEKLEEDEVIQNERKAVDELSEDSFYELLLKVYTRFKNDKRIGNNMPLTAQSLSASGSIAWEKQNMVAQANKKMQQVLDESKNKPNPETKEKVKQYSGIMNSFRKLTDNFARVFKKKQVVEKKAKREQVEPVVEESPEEVPTEEASQVAFVLQNHGELLQPCFPLSKKDVLNPVPGQRQDITFNNSDGESSYSPEAQEYIVNFFNVNEEKNHPVNKGYLKYANAILTIIRNYEETRQIRKKFVTAGNVDSFMEQVLYLKIEDKAVLCIGKTKMGMAKGISKIPKGETVYFRLFVGGEHMQRVYRIEKVGMLKEFPTEEGNKRFKEVTTRHLPNLIHFQVMIIEGLMSIVEGLPTEEFEFLADDELIGFLSLLQQKAAQLMEKGAKFTRPLK